MLLNKITSASNGFLILLVSLFFTYTVMPLWLVTFMGKDDCFYDLAVLNVFACFFLIVGYYCSIFDQLFSGESARWICSFERFAYLMWAGFALFVIVTWVTAQHIPLVSALSGASPEELVVFREQFLKARHGWQVSLVYINAIFTCALIPYVLAKMFLERVQWRGFLFLIFIVYCVSFVEKAYFLKALLPIFILLCQNNIKSYLKPRTIFGIIIILISALTIVSGVGNSGNGQGDFFSVNYSPNGALPFMTWRVVAIPMLTAVDAIRLHHSYFHDELLHGATSSFITALTGDDRVEFERLVFASQWGQNATGTGSANSVFITEAFVNFGWIGLALCSWCVGLIMRFFAKSKDLAFQSLWLLFALNMYSAGLIGTLLSNGYLLVFFLVMFVKFDFQGTKKKQSLHE